MFVSLLRRCVLGGTTVVALLLTDSIAMAQPPGGGIQLPTTEEWIGAWVQGGLQAAEALGGLRDRPLVSAVRRPLTTVRGRLGRGTPTYATPSYSGDAYPSSYTSIPSNPLPTHSSPSAALVSTGAASIWPNGIHVVHPAGNQVAIRFVVDEKPYTLQPGQRLEFAPGAARAIQYDRGGQFGTSVYGLGSAVFTFTPTARGWELFQTAHAQPVLASSRSTLQLPPPIPWPGG